jgi:hypothetical protein
METGCLNPILQCCRPGINFGVNGLNGMLARCTSNNGTRSILILFSHVQVFPSGSPPKSLYTFLISPVRDNKYPTHLTHLDFITVITFSRVQLNGVPHYVIFYSLLSLCPSQVLSPIPCSETLSICDISGSRGSEYRGCSIV